MNVKYTSRKIKMIIGLGIITAFILGALVIVALRIGVSESKLTVVREEAHFPIVSGSNLDRKEFEFPRDFAGKYNLVIIPFQQKQQLDVNTWIPAAQELERTTPGLVYYELPTIYRLPTLSRTFINEGMRAGIPDQTARERTVTLYLDKEKFKAALEIQTENIITLVLVNRQGDLLWRGEGRYSEETLQDLLITLEELVD
jgi:hypothetical protein